MDTGLLSLIKSESERRNAPAVQTVQNKLDQARLKSYRIGRLHMLFRAIRSAYRSVFQIATIKPTRVVLPGHGHKYDEVEKELLEAGAEPTMISKPMRNNLSINFKWGVCLSLFKSTFFCCRVLLKSATAHYFDVVLTFYSLRFWIRKNHSEKYAWIIIGDLSPYLIALSAACKHEGQSVVYWQYSFLDFKHLPVIADDAIILNETGLRLSKFDPEKTYYWRCIGKVKNVDTEKLKNGPVGVLLNVHTKPDVWERIQQIQQIVKRSVVVRLHPNSKLAVPELPIKISVSDSDEPLETFGEKLSFAVCGNTQAQAKLLMSGIPVLQLEGLDLLYFDFHGYVETNIVPGIRNLNEFSLSNIENFYNSKNYKDGLYNLIGPTGNNRSPLIRHFINKEKDLEPATIR